MHVFRNGWKKNPQICCTFNYYILSIWAFFLVSYHCRSRFDLLKALNFRFGQKKKESSECGATSESNISIRSRTADNAKSCRTTTTIDCSNEIIEMGINFRQEFIREVYKSDSETIFNALVVRRSSWELGEHYWWCSMRAMALLLSIILIDLMPEISERRECDAVIEFMSDRDRNPSSIGSIAIQINSITPSHSRWGRALLSDHRSIWDGKRNDLLVGGTFYTFDMAHPKLVVHRTLR